LNLAALLIAATQPTSIADEGWGAFDSDTINKSAAAEAAASEV
jgi:hypothetical protein